MKVPVFYAYPYNQMQKAEFKIRFDGIWFQFYCKRLKNYGKRIGKAGALLIREKVITAQPSEYWQLNKRRTLWTFQARYFYNPPEPIPSSDVYWALSNNRNLIETYHQENFVQWEIIRTVRQCYLCDAPYETESQPYWYAFRNIFTAVCEKCHKRLKLHLQKRDLAETETGRSLEKWELEWSRLRFRDEIDRIARQDRSTNLRWVRKFAAQDKYTKSEFKALCNQYGNVCLRCRKKRVLVADHIIPIALGGKNDITNIQPLCRKCNGIKNVDSTDYRKKWRQK
jgi:5-methylcytosine-specific restriction endonuclease McrA